MTLIELIVVIVVMGIALSVLLKMWADVTQRSVHSESLADAMFYGQDLLEEIKTKKFDENTTGWTAPLAAEAGESRTGVGNASFDDVDDYNGYSEAIPNTGFSRCVTVDYMALNATTWQGTCSPSNPVGCTAPVCSNSSVRDYKRIRVRAWRNGSTSNDVVLMSIRSGY